VALNIHEKKVNGFIPQSSPGNHYKKHSYVSNLSTGQPYSWEAVDHVSANYTPDITPLILAAHKNNYEILKILLDRGASLPTPHDLKCSCDECMSASQVTIP
jgi:hypothetical protein